MGRLYVLKPNVFGGTVSNSNVAVEQKGNGNEVIKSVESSNVNINVSNVNALADVPTNSNSNPTISTKKTTPEKTTAENLTPKTPPPAKVTTNETSVTSEIPAAKKETNIVAQDQEGNKVYEDGTVRAKDGTIVTPDGKVMKNGVVITNPRQNPSQPRPMPPDTQQRPPMTREQIENLPPNQRRKAIQIMKRRNQQMPPKYPQQP